MGPTASGKSALALALAHALDGEIVNADSMQMYRDLRVLTARPSEWDEKAAPHRLYGLIDAAQRFSVGQYLTTLAPVLADLKHRGRHAIIVGGTGLYFKAMTQGLVDAPAVSETMLQALRAELAERGPEALHGELDFAARREIRPHDTPRLLRALGVWRESGRSLHGDHDNAAPVLAPGDWMGIALTPSRGIIYEAIDRRFDAMVASGAVEEAKALFDRGLDPSLPCMKAHGMPWFAAHFRGEMAIGEAIALSKRDTRHYAKRQFTWIRGQMPDWTPVEDTDLDVRRAQIFSAMNALTQARR